MPVDYASPAPNRRGATPPGGVSTIDLFSWSEGPDTTRSPAVVRHNASNDSNPFLHAADQNNCESPVGRPTIRMHQPAGGVSTITFGEQLSSEEAEALLKKRPGSDFKRREMHGSGIFNGSGSGQSDGNGPHADRTTVRMHQQLQQPRGRTQSDAKHKELNGSNIFPQARCRPTSDAKAKELNGSNIFGYLNIDCSDSSPRIMKEHQEYRYPPNDLQQNPAGGVSQISFGGEECASPKKPVTIPEVAKQKELSGTVETTDDATARRCFSNAKAKELVGSNIFGPAPPEPKKHNRSLEMREEIKAAGSEAAQPRSVHTSVKVSNPAGGRSQISFSSKEEADAVTHSKKHEMKSAELSGHDIFSEGNNSANKNQQHHLSQAKLKEMSGSDIFSDDKPRARDIIGGIRKPPGGGSSISLN